MIRITLQYLWGLSEQLEPLGKLDPSLETTMSTMDLMIVIWEPQSALETLISGSVFASTLRSSKPHALHLRKLMNEQTSKTELEDKISNYVIWQLKQAYDQFKIAFLAELATFPAYFVSQKGSHDTLTLLDQPVQMFPADLQTKVPEAMYDVAEAGKALCYELPTACGFHLFRVTEAVLRRYYSHVTGGSAPPKVRNIMVYVNAMRQKKCGDEVILSVIEQMSKLHRNPLIHPEAALTLDEAISIHGIARSAVTAMLTPLPTLQPTTGVSLQSVA